MLNPQNAAALSDCMCLPARLWFWWVSFKVVRKVAQPFADVAYQLGRLFILFTAIHYFMYAVLMPTRAATPATAGQPPLTVPEPTWDASAFYWNRLGAATDPGSDTRKAAHADWWVMHQDAISDRLE